MEELENMSRKLEALSDALCDVCLINPKDSTIYRKCMEMYDYINSCRNFVDSEIDKLIDAGTV